MRHTETFDRQAVNEGDVGFFGKRFKCPPHRKVGGAEDVDPVDLLRPDHCDSPHNCRVSRNLGIQ
jgi:hypothetical protein